MFENYYLDCDWEINPIAVVVEREEQQRRHVVAAVVVVVGMHLDTKTQRYSPYSDCNAYLLCHPTICLR